MTVSGDIVHVAISDEFKQCQKCRYDRGFHTSLVRIAAGRPAFPRAVDMPGMRRQVRCPLGDRTLNRVSVLIPENWRKLTRRPP